MLRSLVSRQKRGRTPTNALSDHQKRLEVLARISEPKMIKAENLRVYKDKQIARALEVTS